MNKSPEFLVGLVVLALILVAALVYFLGVPLLVKAPTKSAATSATPVTTGAVTSSAPVTAAAPSGTTRYTDPNKVYSFTYPTAFNLSGGEMGYTQGWMVNATTTGLALVKVVIPQSFEPKTNFGDATFTVGTSADPGAVATCLAAPQSGTSVTGSKVTINGVSYSKYVTSDAGAGNLYKTTSYRTVHNGQCYAIEYMIHSGNIQNYPTDSGITSFDESKVQTAMESIVQSFAFSS